MRDPSPSGQEAFLQRLALDATDRTTPLGAFLAGLPPAPPRRHAKTSSERGRAFRERQQRKEKALGLAVAVLRREVARLDLLHKAWQTRCLTRRSSPTGSLMQLTHEYHRLFTHGLETGLQPERGLEDATRRYQAMLVQESFLRRSLDAAAVVGTMVGPEASIVQWRRYTQAHDGLTLEVVGVEITESPGGEDDDEDESVVALAVRFLVHTRLSLNTFKMLFPSADHDGPLVESLVGAEVTYPASRRLRFTREGRIAVEEVDVDFIAGLNSAGVSLLDIHTLFHGAAITRDSMILETHQLPAYHERPIDPESKQSQVVAGRRERRNSDALAA